MPGPLGFLIPGAISLFSSLMGGTRSPNEFNVGNIDNIIDSFRKSGMEGIKQLGIQERGDATSRLAASGMDPSLALQQSLFNPIMEKLGSARTNLEGQLGQMRGQLELGQAQGQQRADLAEFGNITNMFAGFGDLAGMFGLQGLQNYGGGSGGGNDQAYTKPIDLWNIPGMN